ncbi:UPF0145 protein [Leifsonia sp. LS1]|nr:heavy metal-binding domain-containing protein [Leifsonia sp. LS1]GIT81535.1 UPF0145 protein [Leifsonia sp. LS1]
MSFADVVRPVLEAARHPPLCECLTMLIVTTNDIPGRTVTNVIGEVFGLTVRSRNLGSNLGAGFKSLAGGELKGITSLLHDARTEALGRLADEAQAKGADAVLAFRFETNDYGQGGVEVCAYGTAVTLG